MPQTQGAITVFGGLTGAVGGVTGAAVASRCVGTVGMPTGGVRTDEPGLLGRPGLADPLLELPTGSPFSVTQHRRKPPDTVCDSNLRRT